MNVTFHTTFSGKYSKRKFMPDNPPTFPDGMADRRKEEAGTLRELPVQALWFPNKWKIAGSLL
jgi:hypothetical protein